MSSALKLFDLAGADAAVRFSPYCWRARLALAHKGLPVETIPWRFTEKEAIAASGQGKVPVLLDGERCVCDSWAIAEYLEAAYPTGPHSSGRPRRAGWRASSTSGRTKRSIQRSGASSPPACRRSSPRRIAPTSFRRVRRGSA